MGHMLMQVSNEQKMSLWSIPVKEQQQKKSLQKLSPLVTKQASLKQKHSTFQFYGK